MNPNQQRGGANSGLSREQSEALDAWAVERDMPKHELVRLKRELAGSVSHREEVFGAPESDEIVEEKGFIGKTIDFFRKGLSKILVGLGIIGLVGGTLYIGKQAVDAAKESYKDTLQEEFGERAERMADITTKAALKARELATSMFDFLVAIPEQFTEKSKITEMVVAIWKGIKQDGKEFMEEGGDKSPDKLVRSVLKATQDNPELKNKWKKVLIAFVELEKIPHELEEIRTEITSFSDDDKVQAWERFEENFWEEVREPFTKKGEGTSVI